MRRHALADPDATAVTFGRRRRTYAELDAACDRAARALIAASPFPGARLCYLGKNSDVFVELVFAALRSRCCVVPVNWRLTIDEACRLIEDSTATLLFADAAMMDLARAVAERVPGIRVIATDGTGDDAIPYREWRDAERVPSLPTPHDDDVFLQIYTSGTSGRPKGVMVTRERYGAHLSRLRGVGLPWFVYQATDIVLVAMPFFHLSGCCPMLDTLDAGGHVAILPEFHAGEVVDALHRHGITRTFIVPAALQTMIGDPRLVLDRLALRYVAYGGSPIASDLLRRAMHVLGCEFVHFYGMTETLNSITGLAHEDHRTDRGERWRSVGKALPGMNIRIVDATGRSVPPQTLGEIQLSAPFMTSGYWRQPDATRDLRTSDGWLKTGDAGRLDEDGFLYIEDRMTDMMISGGENIYPLEIETILNSHPDIVEVAVVGAADERWGERVVAFVVVRCPASFVTADVQRWAEDRLSSYKRPKQYFLVDVLPRNAAGKILRRTLRDEISNTPSDTARH